MAMIVCPHCGEQVSEKAKQCVYCGALLIAEEKNIVWSVEQSLKRE